MDLFGMKIFLDDLVQIFKTVLDLECTIINANPIKRVSGTGIYQENPNTKHWNTSYAIKVIEEKKPYIFIDTTDKLWVKVGENKNYYSVILQPVLVDNIVEGVIVLASLNEKQQNILKGKSVELQDYLEKIALLISAKFKQEQMLSRVTILNNQLSTIFKSVTDGVILYSKNDQIQQINDKAKKILNYENQIVYGKLIKDILSIGDESLEKGETLKKQIYLKTQGLSYSIIVKAIYDNNDNSPNVIIIINDFKDLQKMIIPNDYEVNDYASHNIVGKNCGITKIINSIDKLANNTSNILLLGESGTGKELFARAIHARSNRRNNPFVAVNCAAIPDVLLESELFGYEEGSFTGAKKGGKLGKFLLANQGTLFLDEIGDMPIYLQAKLLRVLDDMKVDRIGSSKLIDIDIHFISATNKNLEEMILKKEFREDLFYRLNVIPINIPPLRDRKDDIPLLSDYFINKYNNRFEKNIIGFSEEVNEIIFDYNWPGNVRELENCIQYMVSFENEDYIQIGNLPYKLKEIYFKDKKYKIDEINKKEEFSEEIQETLKDLISSREKEIIHKMIEKYDKPITKNDAREICAILDISISSFYRKLK